MTDDERIARLTDLARKVWKFSGDLRVHVDETSAWVSEDPSDAPLLDVTYLPPRALDALEAALLMLAEPEEPIGRGPETLRLRIGYERERKRIAELQGQLERIRALMGTEVWEASLYDKVYAILNPGEGP